VRDGWEEEGRRAGRGHRPPPPPPPPSHMRCRPVDPCAAYANSRRFPPSGVPCPSSTVAIGQPGRRDVMPIATVLQAAGVASLDRLFDPKSPSDYTMR
jgi:hypothetical protein